MKIAFYTATRPGLQGLYNRLTRWIDRGPYSHCELIFSDGLSASSSCIDGGVRFKRIEFDADHWEIIEVGGDEAAARAWFEMHNGAPYDFMGTARFVFGFLSNSAGKWFCSEAVAAALGLREAWRFGPCGLFSVLEKTTSHPAAAGFFTPTE